MKIILASGSPRRKELLERMGVSFSCMPSQKEEEIGLDFPDKVAVQLAVQKAEDILQQVKGDVLVIGADTLVACEKKILGKPRSEEEAFEMLCLLQGRSHLVYTGVALLWREGEKLVKRLFEDHTIVRMYQMTEREIRSYIATKEPMDKAGAYAIQGRGAFYIQGIEGEYDTVVGFPVARFYQELKDMGAAEFVFGKIW